MSTPRDHHFIPAFYLRRWCDASGKLIEYTIKHGKLIPKSVGPNATGYEFDLYAFPELPPDQSQFLEQKFFDYADRTAADALKLHLTGNTTAWNVELVSAWSRFVMALHCRHPDAMPELRAAAKAIWEGSGKAAQQEYERIRLPSDPDTYDEYIASLDPLIAVKARLNLVARAFDNEVVGQHINNMKWGVVDVAASPYQLLTSDRPVGLVNIKDPKGFITLPISPTKLFVAVNDSRIFDHLKKPKEIVHFVNTLVVERARRFVWVTNQSQMAFIQKHMSTRLEPTPFFPNLDEYPPSRSLADVGLP